MDAVELDETTAIERAVAGDHAAFGTLVERYQQVAFRAAYLIVRDAHEAEDVTQEAFERAHRQLGRFRSGEPLRPWLLRIVQNQALNTVRARKRRTGLFGRVAMFSSHTTPSPHAEVAASDESSQVLAAIAELPDDDRTILHLRYFLELPEREIAAAIGRPPGTVKSRLHRAGQRLRTVIETKYPHLREIEDA